MSKTVVCALYKFVRLNNYRSLRQPLLDLLQEQQIRGTILLAAEGINGTIAGSRQSIDALLSWLRRDSRLKDIDYKESLTDNPPFLRTRVKLKKEIVTLGVEGLDPNKVVGTYVDPQEWNRVISDPEVLLIDTRNDYEVQVGSFKNAINPQTDSFRELPRYVQENLDPQKHRKIAMFCTGGIRCEKSTAYLKSLGFEDVYHLRGGILRYLEEVPAEQSLWEGECFVFDERVTVNHRLEPGEYDQCHACRTPITEADKKSTHYKRGVSCPHCHEHTSPEQKQRFRERQQQIDLARQRGKAHLGPQAAADLRQACEAKPGKKNL